MRLLNTKELSFILQIKSTTVDVLVSKGKIPYTIIPTGNGEVVRFIPDKIRSWLKGNPSINMNDIKYLTRIKTEINEENPCIIKELKKIDSQFSERRESKGYYLVKIKSKKYGFLYYVRYIKDGKLIPTKRCTYTNNREAAERWAVENREKVLNEYFNRNIVKKKYGSLYVILKKYYSPDSPYLEIDIKRGRELNGDSRESYHNFIIHQFIPFLHRKKIKDILEIDVPLLAKFQNYLLLDRHINGKMVLGCKPQTINRNMSIISLIFDHLITEGEIKTNPCKSLVSLKVKEGDIKITGCYEINALKGVFNKKWENIYSYMLCLLIYTTDMRNSEIEKMQVKDIITFNNIHFIDIPKSKSINGVRIVPLHDFVYKKLLLFIRKNNLKYEDFIFKKSKTKNICSTVFKKACLKLACYAGFTEEKMKKENIRFYSGRHFWKTLMNSEGLGEIEEYFMGHKVTSNIAKRYNHKDKQGKKKLLERARKVFYILDKNP